MIHSMKYNLPQEVTTVMNKFSQAGYQIYIVGGAVRDLIMGREVKDWDFTTDATPEQILEIIPEGFYNNKFGTVGVVARGDAEAGSPRVDRSEVATSEDARGIPRRQDPEQSTSFEITTMRKEGKYEDFRHPTQIAWTTKIEEDLARRDFTINAIAMDTNQTIIDPFNGQTDLAFKLIKAVGDPHKRFQEDALRIIRTFRFASQLEFDIDKQTFECAYSNRGLLQEISWERIRDEFLKLLAGLNPYISIKKLREAGILEIILPEVERCFGISQEGPKHVRNYDIGEHSLLTLKETPSTDPLVRFAALIHDIGKPDTMRIGKDGNVTFYNHDLVGGKLALKIADHFKLSKKDKDKLYRLVRWHLFVVDEKQTDSAIRRFIKNVGKDNVHDMLTLRIGDRLGGGTQKAISWRMEEFMKRIEEVSKQPFTVSDLKVSGHDVMKLLNLPPGPKVGEILNTLFEEVAQNSSKNDRDYLLERVSNLEL